MPFSFDVDTAVGVRSAQFAFVMLVKELLFMQYDCITMSFLLVALALEESASPLKPNCKALIGLPVFWGGGGGH